MANYKSKHTGAAIDQGIDNANAALEGLAGKLDANKLPEAINTALAQAKASGEFDGKDGKDGADGKDGYTPVKGVDYFDGKDGIDGKDGTDGKDGANGKDGKTPVKGTDYFTEAEQAEMVNAVLANFTDVSEVAL